MGFELPLNNTFYARNIYWVFGLLAPSEDEKNRIVHILNENKIATRPFFWCMHEQPAFKKMNLFLDDSYPNAEKMARNGFYLPSGLGITDEDLNRIVEVIEDAY